MVNPNEDTELHGILPPKPPSRSPSPDLPQITHRDAIQAIAATADEAQLNLLLEGDNLDSDDEAMYASYRQKRMEQMRREEKRGRFGSMEPLTREDFVREVTEGSREVPPGQEEAERDVLKWDGDEAEEEEGRKGERNGLRGTGVVVFLFKDSVPLSQHLRPLLNRLAAAHPATKFLSIPAGLCIPNYPDKNVPTLLVYRDGEMLGQVVAGAGLKGMRTTVQDLQGLLLHYRALEKPSPALRERRREDSDEDEEGTRDGVGMVNARGGGGIRSGGGVGTGRGKGPRRGQDSDGSDFDM